MNAFMNGLPRLRYWHHELQTICLEMMILEKGPRSAANIAAMEKLNERTVIVVSNIQLYLIQERSKLK